MTLWSCSPFICCCPGNDVWFFDWEFPLLATCLQCRDGFFSSETPESSSSLDAWLSPLIIWNMHVNCAVQLLWLLTSEVQMYVRCNRSWHGSAPPGSSWFYPDHESAGDTGCQAQVEKPAAVCGQYLHCSASVLFPRNYLMALPMAFQVCTVG